MTKRGKYDEAFRPIVQFQVCEKGHQLYALDQWGHLWLAISPMSSLVTKNKTAPLDTWIPIADLPEAREPMERDGKP